VTRVLLLAVLGPVLLAAQERVVESVIPALAYGPSCSSTVELRNLGDRTVTVEVEGHRESGALVPLGGLRGTTVRLGPHERGGYKLEIEEETLGAWVKVREKVPAPGLSPVVAVAGSTECRVGDQLRTAGREVAYPTRNPWFDGDVGEMPGNQISLINTTERAARARACYSAGSLYSVPERARIGAELQPICTASLDVLIPPFGAREFAVSREGSTRLALKAEGNSIVLEMLRPLGETLRIYTVDSTIQFGSEVPGQ
jgi:hypothetical protein